MIERLLRLPASPRHDPEKDGNPFDWIVATAPEVREQRMQLQREHREQIAKLED